MSDEEELFDEARRSREETQDLREESGLGRDAEPDEEDTPDDPLPEKPDDSEPWAKFSTGRDPDE